MADDKIHMAFFVHPFSIALIFVNAFLPSWASPISSFDEGVYAVQGKDGQPPVALMRLSISNSGWRMEGRLQSESDWSDISCDHGCQYRESTKHETELYTRVLSSRGIEAGFISCIQNIAQAFCRIGRSDAEDASRYLLIALVRGNMVPIPLYRLE